MNGNHRLAGFAALSLLLTACAGQPTAAPEQAQAAEAANAVKQHTEQAAAAEPSPAPPAAVAQSQMKVSTIEPEPVAVEPPSVPQAPAVAPNPAPAAAHASHAMAQTEPAPSVPEKTDPNSYFVTLVKKNASHPYQGIGDANGFAIDGVQGGEIVLRRGVRYTFEVKSNPMHDFYFTSNEMGWGADMVGEGVENQFIYEGATTFTPGPGTPDVLYYQCRNHKAMGSRIFVIDKDADVTLAELRQRHGSLQDLVQRPSDSGAVVSAAEVDKKLAYAGLVAMSKPAKRVRASDDAQAKALLVEAEQLIATARSKHAAGEDAAAMGMIDEALRKMSAASQQVPSEDLKEEQRQRYAQLRKGVDELRQTHKDAYDRLVAEKGASAGVKYDAVRVDQLTAQAQMLAQADQCVEALKPLQEAERLVTTAINTMLDSQTVTYKLDLDTPQGEFKYEADRYRGYAALAPVAVEEKQPAEGQRKLFDDYVAKADAMAQKAQELAGGNDYADAIRLMQEATNTVRRALRLVGVQQ